MSMLRSVLTYMGLGPDEDYDDGYLYEADHRSQVEGGRRSRPEVAGEREAAIDLRDDPHAQRARPTWMDDEGDEHRSSAGRRSTGEHRTTRGSGLAADTADEAADGATDLLDDLAADTSGAGPGPTRGRHDIDRDGDRDSGWGSDRGADRDTDGGLGQAADRVRPLRAVPPTTVADPDDGFTVAAPRTIPPVVVAPASFADAKVLADEFTATKPVVMNLQQVDRDLARRLIDFASGVCYALDGGMEKLANAVFLLTPPDVDVAEDDRVRLEEAGYQPD